MTYFPCWLYDSMWFFADDATFFVLPAINEDLGSLINRLEHESFLATEWFQNNYIKLNKDKCHLLIGGYKNDSILAKIGDSKIWESDKQKLLGVHIDRTLSFDEHASNLCKKAGRKLPVLASLLSYITLT